MKFDHLIKYNGVLYPTGADVPVGNISTTEEKKVEMKTIDNSVVESKTPSKTDIAHMKTDELRTLAIKEGIENASEISGQNLKSILVEHFGL